MDVVLQINGKAKTFTPGFISGRAFRRTLEVQKVFSDGQTIDENTLDTMVDYVVELFGKQFTRDEFYDGIQAAKLLPTITDCIDKVVSGASEAVGVDPNAQ
jgi:hypothetical protein